MRVEGAERLEAVLHDERRALLYLELILLHLLRYDGVHVKRLEAQRVGDKPVPWSTTHSS